MTAIMQSQFKATLWYKFRSFELFSDISQLFFYLRQRRRYMFLPVFVCLSVCLYVCLSEQDYSKGRAWIWMKCCVSTDIGTWTNWLTFGPDPDFSPDAGTGLLSPILYALHAEFYYVGKMPPIGIGLQWLVYSPRAVGTTLSEEHAPF